MVNAAALGLLADAVLVIHLGIVVFVVGALVLVIAGNRLGWAWVNHLWLRVAHLGAIGFVVAESWLGITCPLTTLESWLRALAGTSAYDKGFIEHWIQRALFHEAPPWVFIVTYTVFFLMVVALWRVYPPSSSRT